MRRIIRKILIIAWDFLLCLIINILFVQNFIIFNHVECQTLRNFPPLFNVAKNQPIQTTPAQSSCGIPTPSAYCGSTNLAKSIFQCHQDFCVQDCPRRTSLPAYDGLLLSASGYDICVLKDNVNKAPKSSRTDFSAIFKVGTDCYLTPQNSLNLGANGAFTVLFWIWLESSSTGTIIEKWSTQNAAKTTIFRVSISPSTISLVYNSAFGYKEVQFSENIPSQVWTNIAIQVYDVSVSLFLNGVGLGFTASSTKGLVGRIQDQLGTFRIGQNSQGGSQFVGRLQDVRFYPVTLTNREIQEVYSDNLPEVRIFSSCRCPPSHPRTKPLDTRYCIQNGVPDNFGDDVFRLNNASHPLGYLNDGDSNSMWISSMINDVYITVDLQDQFQVFYVVLQFYSPQPKIVTIERQVLGSNIWQTWQLYAEDCTQAFNRLNNAPFTEPTSVNCLQFGTNGLFVPYSKGNITFSLLASAPVSRPGHNDFYNTPALHEFVNTSKIRIHMQQHYYVTHPQHMYYGVYELIVTGRCNCHGHGDICDTTSRPYVCQCSAESNTEGNQCEICKPLYNDKPFRDGDQLSGYNCKPCQCYGHASSCVYNQTLDPFPDDHDRGGGGMCVNCKDNTEGHMCEICRIMYYRAVGKNLYALDVCSPCQCYVDGVDGSDLSCDKVGGQCKCKMYTTGRQCDQCKAGYYNLRVDNQQGCDSCMCHLPGTVAADVTCHPNLGKCNCKTNVRGLRCDTCQFGYYNLAETNPAGCTSCLCNPLGSLDQNCDVLSGQCMCKDHVSGRQCDMCGPGFYNFASGCLACDCDTKGSEVGGCNRDTGQCVCKPYTTGIRCDLCQDGYYNLGGDSSNGCVPCGCGAAGTEANSSICDKISGECTCKENVQGRSCNLCKANAFNLTLTNPQGCQSCGCDPSGTETGSIVPLGQLSCDHNTGQCTCLANRFGRRCEQCNIGFYTSLEPSGGCLPCDCFNAGTIRLTNCDSRTGQCQCYGDDSGITGRRCDTCKPLHFNLNPATRSCSKCECDLSGSVNESCNANTGQCICKSFTTGRQCGQCVDGTSNLQQGNPYGCSKAPSQQPPPSYVPLSPTELMLFWDGPDHPNGVILTYIIYRDSQNVGEINATNGLTFNDTGLTPFTDYQYQIEAVNSYGSTRSSMVTYRTPAGKPTGTLILKAINIQIRSASFSWVRPITANGIIQKYVLVSKSNLNQKNETKHYSGLALNVTVNRLTPYTNYTFRLEACTGGGCLYSDWLIVITGETLPEGQGPPSVVAVSSTELYVTWEPPQFPNGIIIYYELWMRGILGSGPSGTREPPSNRIFHPAGQYNPLPYGPPSDLPEPVRNYSVVGLEGYTQYEFQVISENAYGKAASEWVTGRTATAVPQEMPTPVVVAVSSSSVNLTWSEPTETEARGVVEMYMVYHLQPVIRPNSPTYSHWTVLGSVTPSDRYYLVSSLEPYREESFIVGLCNSVGCVNSTVIKGTTLIAAPGKIEAPIVEGFNASVMNVSWTPPQQLNGPPPRYVVRRTTGAFNSPPPLVSKGTRFPGTGYYKFPSNTIPQGVAFTGISLWFKTSQRDALIMFAASEGGQEEFIAVQIRAGRPWFLFDPQDCTVYVTPNVTDHSSDSLVNGTTNTTAGVFTDGKWHHLVATRSLRTAYITIDDVYTGFKTAECSSVGNIIGDNSGVYVGGLPKSYIIQRKETDIRAQVIRASFQGCLRDIQILTSTSQQDVWSDLDWTEVTERDGAMPDWEGCPDNLDVGYHFLGTGYTIYQSGIFTGGPVIDFQFYMRTELQSGLLFFAYGGVNVYYLIQVLDGGLYVEFSNTNVRQQLLLPNSEVNICDGAWHFIQVYKYHESVSITVDNIYSRSTGSRTVIAIVILASDFYMGGIKPNSEAEAFIKETPSLNNVVQGSFGGCIRNIRINRRPYSIEQYTIESVNLNLDGCPAYHPSKSPCQSTFTETIYNGTGDTALDFNRLPFTEYMYQVEAANKAGSTKSDWATGRTREGAPTGVYPPTTVEVINGHSLLTTWKEPEGITGRLTQFALKAYNLENPSLEPVETWFNASVFKGTLDNVIPFTNYSISLIACTKGGCNESIYTVFITTVEEAPGGVQSPKILTSGGTFVVIGWGTPTHPNGILTGYFLYQEGKAIYSGAATQFNVTNLAMYTGYRFWLQACTRVGCTNSSTATLTTSQLPPSHVNPPQLTVLGTNRMEIKWNHPDQLNGVLERYVLYMSTNSSDIGDTVYNNTDLFTMTILKDLIPGTTYYVKLSACTYGGCRISDASVAKTEESAPEGVYNPAVTSPSPSELLVRWQQPQYPNGIITMYKLYHNGLLIYNSSSSLQHTIASLLPWSLHELRLEACTTQGCGSSDTVQARTQEAPPQGTVGIDLKVTSPREVDVKWNAIATPNGLVFYDLYFEGLYYVNPVRWDYNVVTERRSLLQTTNLTGHWVNINGLIPHSTYYVQINASNTKGFILSNILQANMPMGAPDGVKPPTLTSPNSTSVRATWQGVGRTNANQIPAFQLQFMETLLGVPIEYLFAQPSTSTTFLKVDLKPFTEYSFRLIAVNAYGQTTSNWATVITKQSYPGSIDPPIVSKISTRVLDVSWGQPYQPNGVIKQFKLYQNGTLINTYEGNITKVTVEHLIPFTSYVYVIEACTMAGCTSSLPSTVVTTLKAFPEGIAAPTLISQTPTSVLITWTEPQFPNGVLLQYIIERRHAGETAVKLVKTFLPEDPKQYMDEDRSLTPHTEYDYRIGAYTEIGVGYGPWAQIRTKSSGPGGVFPPTVNILSPTSMNIKWELPLQPNGRIESYVIKLPSPRYEIYNTSITSLNIDTLTPYTQYRVSLTVCTDGGCTESSPTIVTTSPALPDGIDVPVPTTHSQTFISVVWQPPLRPNGPSIRYELARSKIRQPLIVDATGFGTWTSIYSGLNTYVEDRGITMYTTYVYRLTVYNDFGYNNSDPSVEVTTYGGTPRKAAVVSAYSVNHTAIEVRWETPTIFELQGGATAFIINMTGFNISKTLIVPGTNTNVIVSGLQPNTQYGALVTLVVHGGRNITSKPVYATTTDGAPEGLSPPQLYAVNQTTLRISWTPPVNPNGQINVYYIYVDGTRIKVGGGEDSTYILDNLKPYTIYLIQLEACTEYACVKSSTIQATTAESAPSDLVHPVVDVLGPTSVLVKWQPPLKENGIILRYELYKKSMVACTKPENPDTVAKKCTYFECGVVESFCGDKCYSGPKTCCNGVLHDNKAGYECCDTTYIPQRAHTDDICCGGHFYSKLHNHQCCGNRYVPVSPGKVCCTDPTQDRVVVDYGDKCCLDVPYYVNNASQICCSGMLVDKYGQQCCGEQVVSDTMKCCGGTDNGVAYTMDSRKYCCGDQYSESAISVCCTDELGRSKVHSYPSNSALISSNEKCCGTQRISMGLSCCNGAQYNPLLQACADISNMNSGCGRGLICPISQSSSAFCNSCTFDRTSLKCGSYLSPPSKIEPIVIGEVDLDGTSQDLCLTGAVKVYTGTKLNFTDNGLQPYTEYQYSITVVNSVGSASTPYVVSHTSQSLPVGVNPPTATTRSGQLDTIYLTWEPPQYPNGEILWYILMRDDVEIFRNPFLLQHKDNNAIQPYQTYSYMLKVCNGAGCVSSNQIQAATLQAKPSGVGQPSLQALTSTSLYITWSEPSQPNGYISRYELYRITQGLIANVSGSVKDFTVQGLVAYGEYSFVLSACTSAGCTNSTLVTGRTKQDKPQGVAAPILIVSNSTVLEVYWTKPQAVNGIILAQKLYRSANVKPYELIYMGGAQNFSYVDNAVQPSVTYQYIIEISTVAGSTNSTAANIMMPTLTPNNVPKPHNVTVLSATDIYIAWLPVNVTTGNIDQYKVLLNAGKADQIEKGVATDTSDIVVGLNPYTQYDIRIQACISGVPNGCGTGPGVTATTFEAPPTDLTGPSLTAVGSSSVMIAWKPPIKSNGVITQYRIYRRLSGQTVAGLLVNVIDGSVHQYTNIGQDLTPFTEFEYNLVAVNSKGETISPWVKVRTLEAPPNMMSEITIEATGSHSVMLSWQPPSQANGVILSFRVDYRILSEDPTAQLPINAVSVLGSILRTSVSGLEPYTKYEFRVAAVNSVGSASSNWVDTTTGQAAPSDLSQFGVVKSSTGTSVILRWNPPGKPNGIVNNYLIYEEGNVNAIYQGLNREFEYRRLQPYTQYTVQLEACTVGGCTISQMQKFFTAEIPPQNQPIPKLGTVTGTEVTLQWTKPLSINGKILYFEVLRQSIPRIQKRQISQPQVVYKTTDTQPSQYQYTDINLKPFTKYQYKIRTVNSAGNVESPALVVETSQMAPIGVAAPLVLHVGTNYNQLSIKWSAPTEPNGQIQSYQLKRNNTIISSFAPSNPKSYTDTGLIAYTLYSYTVTVCTGGGCTKSLPTVIRTPEAPPFTMAPPTVQTINSTAIKVIWTPPQIINGQISMYRLKLDNVTVYSGLELKRIVNNLIPYKAYVFSLVACTLGGCTESVGLTGRPDEAPPTGLEPPSLLVMGSNSIEISWNPPRQPNGIITSYEIRRDGTLIQTTTQGMMFIDFTVAPGQEYSYSVTAYNSKGSTTSLPRLAKTNPAAPAGLSAPQLIPISSTAIKATWSPPLKPNGDIYNYTLYVNNREVFSGNALSKDVIDLLHYTEYTFRVGACTSHGCAFSDVVTARTLEAPPTNLASPTLVALANKDGVHAGVAVHWQPPGKPNGVITRYTLYRRNSTGLPNNIFTGPSKQIYNYTNPLTNPNLYYEDYDIHLLPYTDYEYSVTAYNIEGQVRSIWSLVKTSQAPPTGVAQPVVLELTSSTITVEITQPKRPNGILRKYQVAVDLNVEYTGTKNVVTLGSKVDTPKLILTPYTVYSIQVGVCTDVGCTLGPARSVTTGTAIPQGVTAPIAGNITPNSMNVVWKQPEKHNGPVTNYELHWRQTCPYPYANQDDEIELPCTVGPWQSAVNGQNLLGTKIIGLSPYTSYELRLTVFNEVGQVEKTSIGTTRPTAPTTVKNALPTVTPINSVLVLDWGASFHINAEVVRFVLYVDGVQSYAGSMTKHTLVRQSIHKIYEFQVELITTYGAVKTDKFTFDPATNDVNYVSTSAPKVVDNTPFYETVWFIIIIAIVAIVIIIIGLICCFIKGRQRQPYIRERQPLDNKAKSTPVFAIDSNNTGDVPNGTTTKPKKPHTPVDPHYLHPQYVNPSYSSMSVGSPNGSLADLHLDQLSHRGKWEDEDDVDSLLDGIIPTDSGLHSLAYGDDYDSDRPMSVLREHMMFPDTHL